MGEIQRAENQGSINATSRSHEILVLFQSRTTCERRCAHMGAFSFSVYPYNACTRASRECMERKMRSFYALDVVSAIYGTQEQEVPHKVLTQRRRDAEER